MATFCNTMKKRICIVGEFPPPYGGIAQQALLLKNLLQTNGVGVKSVTTNLPTHGHFASISKIPYIKTMVAEIIFLSKLIKNISQSQIVHILASSYLNYFLFTYPAVLMGFILKKPVVIHYHGGAAERFFKKVGILAKIPIYLSEKLIVPSSFLLEVFNKQGINCIIIPNIVDLKEFTFKQRKSFLPKFIITRHLEPEYNIACAIKAFALVKMQIPDAKLNVLGDGSQRQMLERLSKDLNCEDSITFYGAVPNKEISSFYRKADIMLNSSMIDNLPMAMLEAFSSGCVVISTKAGGIPYLIENRKNGLLVDLNDHKGLARAIMWVIENQDSAHKIACDAYKKLDDYSGGEILKALIKVYSDLTM